MLGALLVQERDQVMEARMPWPAEGLRVVTERQPTPAEWQALRFAWRVMAHVKSNTVIFTDAVRTLADRRRSDEPRGRGQGGGGEGLGMG